MEWVSGVMGGVRHSPFSRLKSVHADITADEARARGYITGNEKVEEVFPVLRRITTPHTIYKKQKLDRDDIIDITDFDVVRWLKGEMRFMLDEEIARAILVGDGRDPVVEVDDHIPTTNIRPVYQDSTVYTYNVQVALARTDDEMIDDIITAFEQYRGSGLPTMYVAPSQLTKWLLLKDNDGRRLYRNMGELASEMRCRSIVEVPILDGVENDAGTHNLRAIIVNLTDYTAGADKGGQIAFFDDFDIDYNQYKYLIETRMSGALTVPKSAITLEQSKT
jgi:HK97 family phage major capsid protein